MSTGKSDVSMRSICQYQCQHNSKHVATKTPASLLNRTASCKHVNNTIQKTSAVSRGRIKIRHKKSLARPWGQPLRTNVFKSNAATQRQTAIQPQSESPAGIQFAGRSRQEAARQQQRWCRWGESKRGEPSAYHGARNCRSDTVGTIYVWTLVGVLYCTVQRVDIV